jgi:hypothetical protein
LFPNWKKDLPKRNKISKLKLKRRANFVGMKFGGGGKRGRAKIPSPQPPSFLPARAFSLAREARHQFRSKKVRISSNKRTKKSTGSPVDFLL